MTSISEAILFVLSCLDKPEWPDNDLWSRRPQAHPLLQP